MKKSFLFKGVSVLGAVLLLANVVLPGINAYAYSDETWMWDYVRNEETWNNSTTNGALQVYYANNPSEDLWCSSGKASFNDRVYSGVICSDSNCTDMEDVNLTTIWGENYQTVSGGGKTYYLTMDAEPGDTIYELYEQGQASCTYPNNISGAYFPNGWSGFDVCKYAVQFPTTTTGKCLNELPEDAPAGASIPSWALNLTGTSEANPDWPTRDGKCLYEAKATPQPTKYVKILSFSYPDCTPSYSGRIANGAKAPWISVVFKQEFKGIIKFNYSDYQSGAAVYPRGETIKNWGLTGKTWGEASIPEIFGNEYLVTGGATTFDTDNKFSVSLIPVVTVTFVNGETTTTGEVLSGKAITAPNEPTKGGYVFGGWYLGDELFDFNTPITGDTTLTAKWSVKKTSGGSGGGGGGSSTTNSNKEKTVNSTGDSKSEENIQNSAQVNEDDNKNVNGTNNDNTDSQNVGENSYDQEFYDAYEFAFKNGITTMPSIAEADMNGTLTRIAMAKMLSQYAISVLGKTPDTGKNISFPDVSPELDAQYNSGVTLAYQLGIMGINIDEFRPFDEVTRAEFVTALSRMLFGLADGENLYYETHMQKLLEEKIITVADPDMKELRGYVMIMLMRSADK